jgi:23S rRNA G2445 N2-methylase RlmL
MSARVIVRTLKEDRFLRTDLRDAVARRLADLKPRWISSDPADIEVWVLEALPGLFKCGVRLSSAQMRQHGGRAVERPGALRPTVAAAMVSLAGEPSSLPLLDPFCGSGTILVEGVAAGWSVIGADTDPEAVRVAQANTAGAEVFVGDARQLDRLADRGVQAVVTNLPFGKQFKIESSLAVWYSAILQSMARVTAPRGRIILLVPRSDALERSISRNHDLVLRHSIPMRLLGTPTTIWSLQKTS